MIFSPIRRRLAWLSGWLIGCIFLAPSLFAAPPNIVLIISDDHAWTDYGFMGHPHIQTPHIDRLASTGLSFKRGYVTSSLCCPSLATIMTGKYPHQHKITSNDPPLVPGLTASEYHKSDVFLKGRERMNEHMREIPTLARTLSEHGYLTLQTGKWWQGDYRQGGFTHGMTKGGRHGDDGLTIGRKTMEPIETFLDEATQSQKPFMVWYAPFMPHSPHTPPERLLKKYQAVEPNIHIAKYWAMVEWFDETIGQLTDSLDRRNLRENTLIVYIADNGWIQSTDSPQYAERSKQSPNEGGLRTPIILNWPGTIQPQDNSNLAQSIDLAPTIWKATGISVPEDSPGIDLLNADAVKNRKAIYGECFTHNAIDLDTPSKNLRWRWMIRDQWKLIEPNPTIEKHTKFELYDLASDPNEKTNLESSQSPEAKKLREELDQWWLPSHGT